MKLIFMGTPQFAVPSLDALLNSRHQVVAVVTGPDRPAGRGLQLKPSPVKRFAMARGLQIFQPEKLTDETLVSQLKSFEADLFVVVAFRILPPAVFQIPPQGTINLHASLLPQYRGPAPINWAIIQGEKETGVTIFYIEEQVDTGNIILQKKTSIGPEETAGELHDRLAVMGAELLVKSIDLIEQGKAPRLPQEGPVSKAPKITKEICQIDWNKDAVSIFNLVRGVSPSPGAFTFFNGRIMKIHRVKVEKTFGKRRREPGQIVKIDMKRGEIQVATGQGSISILELQPEGKRQMTAKEFLRGHRLQLGEQFG